MMRNLSPVIAGFSLIIGILPIFLETKINEFYVPIFKLLTLIIAISIASYLITKKGGADRRFIVPLLLTMFFFLLSEIFAFIYILTLPKLITSLSNTLGILVNVFSLLAYIPIYIRLITRIMPTEKYLSRGVKLAVLFITIILVIVISPIIAPFSRYMIENKLYFEFVVAIIFVLIDLDIIAIAIVLTYINWKKKFPIFWFTIGLAWLFKLSGDIVFGYFYENNNIAVGALYDLIYNVGYVVLLIGLVTMIEYPIAITSVRDIEKERKHYLFLYSELNSLATDLITVTSLLRHDLINDFVVIQSGIDLFKETQKEDYLDRVVSRVDVVAERLDTLKSESAILDSLKIQPIDLEIIEDVLDNFIGTNLVSSSKGVEVKANKLLHPVLFNIVQNAFQHGGKNVRVEVEVKEVKEKVKIFIKDDGIGISAKEKQKIFEKYYRGTDAGISGMGLYFAKIIIEMFGGTIKVKDNKPKGTIFVLELKK